MSSISVSVEDFNRRYAYCSGIAPEQISFLSHQGILHIPFYRWDPDQLEVVRHSFWKRSHIFPLYRETEYCKFHRVVYCETTGRVRFDTDFPFPIRLCVDRWDVVIHSGESIVGKYIEHITWLLVGEGVASEFLLEPTQN